MALNLDTAIRLTAQVQGANNIRGIATNLQQLNSTAQLSGRQLDKLYTETQRFAAAAGNSINAIRQQRQALTTLRDAADPASRRFQLLTRDVDQLDARLRRLQGTTREARFNMREALGGAAGAAAMGGGPGAAIGALGGSLAAAGGPAGIAAAAGLAATAGLTVQSVGNALGLEEQSRRLRVMTEDSAALQAGIIALVREQGHLTSTTEATAAAYEILQAGFEKTEDVVSVLRASTLGATAGFTDVKTVADALTSVINGYGFSTLQASRLVDQMKAATDDGKISMEQYSQSIGRIIPNAAAAKIPFEEINAAISALTAQGVPVESTFAGINQILASVIKPTKEAEEAAEGLKLQFDSQAIATKGLGGFLADVAAKTGMSSKALGQLFSDIDGRKAVIALLNDDLQRFNKSLDNQADALGRTAEAAEIAIDPIKQFDNAWKDLTSTLGKEALPMITGVVRGMTSLLQTIIDLPKPLKALALEVHKIANPFHGLAAGIGEINKRYRELRGLQGAPSAAQMTDQFGPAVPPRLTRASTDRSDAARRAEDIIKGLDGGEDSAAKKAAKEADKLAGHQRRLAEGLAQREQQLAVQRYQNEMDMQDTLHRLSMQQIEEERQARRGLIEARAELAIAQAPESERWLLNFRRNLINVHTSTTDAILEQERKIADKRQELARAEARLRLAEMNERTQVIRTQMPGAAAGGAGAAMFGATGRVFNAPGWVHGHFQNMNRQSLAADTALVVRELLKSGVTPELGSGARFSRSMTDQQIMDLVVRGINAHKRYASGASAIDVFVPQGTKVPVGLANVRNLGGAAGVSGVLPSGTELMHLDPRSRAGAAPAGEMVTTLPPSQAGREAAQGEVARAQVDLKAAEEGLAKLRTIIQQTGAAQLGTVVAKQIEEINQPLDQLAKSAGDRLAFEREYGELLRTGINPELAQQYVEINRIASKRRDDLQSALQEIEFNAQAKGISDEQKATYEQQAATVRGLLVSHTEQVNKIKEELRLTQEITRQRSLQQDMRIGQGAREGVEGYIQSIGTMREATAQLTQEGIRGLEDQLVSLATTGKANFQEFAVSVLTATARMIIQQLVLRTIMGAIGGIGGSGSQFAQSFQMPSAGFLTSGFSFAGGGYTGNAPRSGGLDGQGGFLAMLHPRETVVDHHKGQGAAAGPTYVTVNVNTTTGETQTTATDSDRRRLGQDIAQVVDARIVHHRRPGGLLNPSRR